MDKMVRAYHWLKDDMTAGNGVEPPWTIGETRTLSGRLKLCERGYHSSPTPADGLEYAWGSILCLVEVSKPVEHDATKQVSHTRKLLKAVNVEHILHEQACRIAEDVLPIYESKYPDDQRPRQAIEMKRKWLDSKASSREMENAHAAYAAAYDAADAAHTVAHATAASSASYAAASSAYAAAAAASSASYAATSYAYAASYDASAASYAASYAASANASSSSANAYAANAYAANASYANAYAANAAAAASAASYAASYAAAKEKYKGWLNEALLAMLAEEAPHAS